MIKQPERESRNMTDSAYASEARQIAKLNEALGDIELTKAEEKSLIWLCGWEESTLNHIISAFEKAHSKNRGVKMKKYYWIIKVKDQMGNYYNNAFVENSFDAINVAKFYRNEMGYDVQLWHEEKDLTFMLDSSKTVFVKK